MPTLSVVMPNYNHGRYVAEALQAIADQSLPAHEVIVIDDASTDDSVSVIEPFTRRYPYMRLLRNERNLGAARSADRGLRECRGEYFICPSADDRVMPGLFEKSCAILSQHPRAGLCAAPGLILSPEGRVEGPISMQDVFSQPRFLSPEDFFRAWVRGGPFFATQTVVFRRAAVLEAGGYPADLFSNTDGYLNVIIPARHGMCFLPEPLAMWRRMSTSYATSSGDGHGSLRLIEAAWRRFTDPAVASLFPRSFLVGWKKHCLLGAYQGLRDAHAPADVLDALLAAIPDPTSIDRAVRALLSGALPPRPAALVSKAYIFAHLPPNTRSRILLSKWLALSGRRRP